MVSFAFCALTLILAVTVASNADDSTPNYNDEIVQNVLHTFGLDKLPKNIPVTIDLNVGKTVGPTHQSIVVGNASSGKSATTKPTANKGKRPRRKGQNGKKRSKNLVKKQVNTDGSPLKGDTDKSGQKFTWKLSSDRPGIVLSSGQSSGVVLNNGKPSSVTVNSGESIAKKNGVGNAIVNKDKPSGTVLNKRKSVRVLSVPTKPRQRTSQPVVQEPASLANIVNQYPFAHVVDAQQIKGPKTGGGGTYMVKVNMPSGQLPANILHSKINLLLFLTINPHIQGAPLMSPTKLIIQ